MVKVDEEKCIGCNACEAVCPEGFGMKSGKAVVKDPNADCIKEAVDMCPTGAIVFDGQETEEESTDENVFRGQGRRRGKGRGRKSGGRGRRRR